MKFDLKFWLPMLVSLASFAVSAVVYWESQKAAEEHLAIQTVWLPDPEEILVRDRWRYEYYQNFLVSNLSSRVTTISDAHCSTAVANGDEKYGSQCSFSPDIQIPTTLQPGESLVVTVKTYFSPSGPLERLLVRFYERFPEEHASSFLSYIRAVYNVDLFGNAQFGEPLEINKDDEIQVNENGKPKNGGTSYGLAPLSQLTWIGENHQSFWFRIETTRGGEFTSERYFGMIGGPAGF